MALEPISEEMADKNSFGYRPYRSVHDAAIYLKLVLGSITATRRFVIKCDIESFFDNISHDWWLQNPPFNSKILKEFLKSGYKDKSIFRVTDAGVPQGGVISPTLANIALDGLEDALGKEFIVVRYCDDFIVLGKSRKELEIIAKERITQFLNQRKLSLNDNKTQITEISKGFDFLGYNFREYPDISRVKGRKKGIFLVKPSLTNIKRVKMKIRTTVKESKSVPNYVMVTKLNSILRGWAEHYKTVTSKKVFTQLGRYV